MSVALRILSTPWRLARAMRRHGMRPVLAFAVLTFRRRGAAESLRLALAEKRQRAGTTQLAVEKTGRPHLEADYTLTDNAWARWRPWVGAPVAGVALSHPDAPPPKLAFVIRNVSFDAEGAARTRETIDRLGGVTLPAEGGPAVDEAENNAFVVFLAAGDRPAEDLAQQIGRTAQDDMADVVSFDLFRREGGRVQPLLLPGANPTLLAATDYFFSRVGLRRALLPKDLHLVSADPRAAVLAWIKSVDPLQARSRWRHIGRPLVEVHLNAAAIAAQRAAVLAEGRCPAPPMREPATVIVCTRDRGHLARQLVRSVLTNPPAVVAEVVIVANGTTNDYALETLTDLARDERVQVLWRAEPFNFSRLANAGVAAANGSGPLLFLNDDIVPVTEDWLLRLSAKLAEPAVGLAGPLLLYPDERVQQAGMYLGHPGGAGHVLRGARLPDQDYLFTAVAPREVSCLTGAVMLVRREAFDALGGFDEKLATYLQDVDFGLRLNRSGWVSVFDPSAVLIHMESVSIRAMEGEPGFAELRETELRRFKERWGDALLNDRYHPAGFDLTSEDLRRLSAARGLRPPMKDGLPVNRYAPTTRLG